MDFIYKNVLGISSLYGLGLLVKKNIRWYLVHAVVNFGVVLLTLPHVIHTLTKSNCLDYVPEQTRLYISSECISHLSYISVINNYTKVVLSLRLGIRFRQI